MSNSNNQHDFRRSARKYRSQAKRVMRENLEQGKIGIDGLHAVRLELVTLLSRIHRMQESLDEAFAEGPFLPHFAPDSPVNRQRFNTFLANNKNLTKLLETALDLWFARAWHKVRGHSNSHVG